MYVSLKPCILVISIPRLPRVQHAVGGGGGVKLYGLGGGEVHAERGKMFADLRC